MTSVSQTRINIRSVANSAKAKTIKRNGRDLIVVPSATLPDNIVMNGIMYPAEEIANSYKTLERSMGSSSVLRTPRASTSGISGPGTRTCVARTASSTSTK
jgi:hypothetical protein